MGSKATPPTLTDARGLGGIIAQDGFDYQLWDGLARLPKWLANPLFEELMFEGLEDLEARFFSPYAANGRLLERYQAKSGSLTPRDVVEVFKSFQTFETAFPGHCRVQTLVTPRLPPTLNWLARDPERVRKARPFYEPLPDVAAASDVALRASLVDQFGATLGTFVAGHVEICERILADHDTAGTAFGLALSKAYPSLDAGAARVASAFDKLDSLARKSVGAPVSRARLETAIAEGLGAPLPKGSFPILLRSDRNESDETALEIDARAFSGGAAGFPNADRWTRDLIEPLASTARWLKSSNISRVSLNGSYRLTTAFVLGWSLRSAIGFDLEVPTREGRWNTDDRPAPADTFPAWTIEAPDQITDEILRVSVGVIRDPRPILAGQFPGEPIMSCVLPEPITSAKAAQHAVSLIKRAVDVAVARLKSQRLDLYFVGPAALAVTLGHRWNAMPPTRLYEFDGVQRIYCETARL